MTAAKARRFVLEPPFVEAADMQTYVISTTTEFNAMTRQGASEFIDMILDV